MTEVADTRSRLLSATREAVRAEGLSGVTSRGITTRAGVNLQAITYHFGSKNELVALALLEEVRTLVDPALELLGDGDRTPSGRLLGSVHRLNEMFDERGDDAPVFLAALAATPHSETVSSGLGELWGRVRPPLAEHIEELRDDGAIPAWIDSQAMAALILAVAVGVVAASVIDPDGPGHLEISTQFAQLLLSVATAAAGS